MSGLTWHPLVADIGVWLGALPDAIRLSADSFSALWAAHPPEHNLIMMHGRPVRIPRWQQAYGRDYAFAGQLSRAVAVPPMLEGPLRWSCNTIDPRLNGLLVNWYDGAKRHYIGPHRDDVRGIVPGSPIVTMSAGEERTLRMRPWGASGYHDIPMADGSVVVIPYATNLRWTHEVPHFRRYRGRRISVTLRAFEG